MEQPFRKPLLPDWLFPRPVLFPDLNLAVFLRNAGRPDLAVKEVRRLWPDEPTPEIAGLGAAAAEEAGILPGFLPELDQALAVSPRSELVRSWLARALFTRAISLMEKGNPGQAEIDLESSVRLAPGQPGPLLALARLAAMDGRRGMAKRLLREALRSTEDPAVEAAISNDPVLKSLLR